MPKGVCNRCEKENVDVSGTPQYKICKDCFNECFNDGSISQTEND